MEQGRLNILDHNAQDMRGVVGIQASKDRNDVFEMKRGDRAHPAQGISPQAGDGQGSTSRCTNGTLALAMMGQSSGEGRDGRVRLGRWWRRWPRASGWCGVFP